MADEYEPSFFGTYSKKIGMWLFLLSDSLTFGALLAAYTYGRVSYGQAGGESLWPTPFHSESIRNATVMTAFLLTSSLTMVLAVRAVGVRQCQVAALVVAGHHGLRCRVHHSARKRMVEPDRGRVDAAVL